jgi:hypothetical protein
MPKISLSPAQAAALEAADEGRLRRWRDDLPFAAAAGKVYAQGIGTLNRPTVDFLMAQKPPLLAEGASTDRDVALTITEAGREALMAHRAPHRGRARR